jgi:succinyl-CoA synthetase alpha subunit
MRRVTPVSGQTIDQKRSLFIKQFQAFDLLKQKGIPVSESASGSDLSVSIAVDRTALSPCIIVSPTIESDPAHSRKFSFPYTQASFDRTPVIAAVASHLGLPASTHRQLAKFVQSLWEIYKEKEAFVLETQAGISTNGSFEVHGARFGFDDAAFRSSGRQVDIHKLRKTAEEVPEEVEAEKDGIVYIKYAESHLSPVFALTTNRLEGEGSVGTLGMYSSVGFPSIDSCL